MNISKAAILSLFAAGLLGGALLATTPAQAEPKPWIFGWAPSHWENQDFQPYIDHPHHPHAKQWDHQPWQVEDWLVQRDGDGRRMIRDFYNAGIITDQYTRRRVPVVEIGPGFYYLGARDKGRVMAVVDSVYNYTNRSENALFMLYDGNSRKPVGIYSREGLQLQ